MKNLIKLPKRSESKIVTACCDYLRAKKHFFWRQNSSGVFRTFKDGRQAWCAARDSMRGIPDIFVLSKEELSVFPCIFAIEVKTDVGRQSPEQKEFQKQWEKRGGVYLLARSIDDLMKAGL